MSILLVTCPFPDEAQAFAAGEAAVKAGLAACCQVGTPVQSVFQWQGKLELAEETPLMCKTTEIAWPLLEAFFKGRHPYFYFGKLSSKDLIINTLAFSTNFSQVPYFQWITP